MHFDVAIIGGGPAGSTTGSMLRKYGKCSVGIFEREEFPRDHVGESQLPTIGHILNEMGAWDKVEAAQFPIKIGATYKWGKTPELWDFEFVPATKFRNEPRPAKFEEQRRFTAFQVDRGLYDQILLDHARELGCSVFEETRVRRVLSDEDRVTSLELEDGQNITADWYVDASGHSGVLRRALGVEATYPTSLQNIAIWDYWQNTEWAVSIGVGGTRVQVLSVGYGWLWFIPLGPTRTSIGLVIPAAYYKSSGKRPEELYEQALAEEPIVRGLIANATSEKKLTTTKDWSFLAERLAGENWFLVGESAGFADPILAAGLSLAHAGARELAFTILELIRGEEEPEWLKQQYQERQSQRISNHMAFADYWYTANAQFTELKDFTQRLAEQNGLDLSPDKAWAWLAQGGFINEDLDTGTGGYSLTQIRLLKDYLSDVEPDATLDQNNVFILDLDGAEVQERAVFESGHVRRTEAYVRCSRILPVRGAYEFMISILRNHSHLPAIVRAINTATEHLRPNPEHRTQSIHAALQAFDALVSDGWVKASYDPDQPVFDMHVKSEAIHWNRDQVQPTRP